jgi:hypothetical protein
MNKVWGEIQELIGNDFKFINTFYTEGSEVCIGLVNGVKSPELVSVYKRHISKYKLELEALLVHDKSKIDLIINQRNMVMVEWLSTHPNPREYNLRFPYKTKQQVISSNENGELEYAEVYDPPCWGNMVNSYERYYGFIHQLTELHNQFLHGLSKKAHVNEFGFPISDGRSDFNACYIHLTKWRYIECEYKNFKNIFSGKSAPKINWIGKAGALKYFIKGITATGRLTVSNKWKRTTECFNLDGRTIASTGKISGAQKNLLQSTKDELNQAISFLFPMSQQ